MLYAAHTTSFYGRTLPSSHGELIMGNSSDRKFFLCTGQAVTTDQLAQYPNSHVIGDLRYVYMQNSPIRKFTALARWETSVSVNQIPDNPEIDILLIGDAKEIKCKCPGCKNKARWEIGKAALKWAVQKYAPE